MSKSNRVIFVGNIAFDVTEEQLTSIFSEVGPVKGVRLVIDRETGRPKGYGFIEYNDANTANSAVRNLSGRNVNGRTIRVDYSSEGGITGGKETSGSGGGGQQHQQQQPDHDQQQYQQQQQLLQPAQQAAVQATEAITQLLASMTPNQLYDLMTQMKILVQSNYDQARTTLVQNPQLTYALFQALMIMKAIPPATIAHVLQSAVVQHQHFAPPQQQQFMPGQPQMYAPPPQAGGMYAQPQQFQQQPPQQFYQQPPQQHLPQQPPSAGAIQLPPSMMNLPEAQKAALMQVLQLTDKQLEALPADQQAQIMQLKAQVRGGI